MAKEKESKAKREGGDKKPKHKLKSIHTHVADDGSFIHEHHYEDAKGNPMPPRFGGVSEDMGDLQQHMQDHLGDQGEEQPEDEGDQQPGAEEQPGGGEPADPAAGGADDEE